jgi:hypothetical protein
MLRDIKKYAHNCLYHTGGKHGREVLRTDLPPLHPALQKFSVPPGHPAYPCKGLRVSAPVPEGTVLGTYAGLWVYALELVDTTPYTFAVDDGAGVEARHYGNLLRYANDARGTGYAPNIAAEIVEIWSGRLRMASVNFVTVRAIEAGEELLLHYGNLYDFSMSATPPWLSDPKVVVDVDSIPVKVKKEKKEKKSSRTESEVEEWEEEDGDGDDEVQVEEDRPFDQAEWAGRAVRADKERRLKLAGQLQCCQRLLAKCEELGPQIHSLDQAQRSLQMQVLCGLRRKRARCELDTEEHTLMEELRGTYDPGRNVKCERCQRELKRAQFGAVIDKGWYWEFPPCNECTALAIEQHLE